MCWFVRFVREKFLRLKESCLGLMDCSEKLSEGFAVRLELFFLELLKLYSFLGYHISIFSFLSTLLILAFLFFFFGFNLLGFLFAISLLLLKVWLKCNMTRWNVLEQIEEFGYVKPAYSHYLKLKASGEYEVVLVRFLSDRKESKLLEDLKNRVGFLLLFSKDSGIGFLLIEIVYIVIILFVFLKFQKPLCPTLSLLLFMGIVFLFSAKIWFIEQRLQDSLNLLKYLYLRSEAEYTILDINKALENSIILYLEKGINFYFLKLLRRAIPGVKI